MEYYSQYDPRWANRKINNTKYTMKTDGCFITSLAMLKEITPLKCLEILENEKCFDGALLISDKASKALGLEYNGISNTKPNHDCIIEYDYKPETAKIDQHFCVSLANGDIIDPLGGKIKPESVYKKISYRLFMNPKKYSKNQKLELLEFNQKSIWSLSDRIEKAKHPENLRILASKIKELTHESADIIRELK